MKAYWQYMSDFSPDELYKGLLLGMFTEKLPPILTMEGFEKICQSRFKNKTSYSAKKSKSIRYDSIRNTGASRRFGIPNPFNYEELCRFIKQNWPSLLSYFKERTRNQKHKVSQIHIRKQKDTGLIFKMNYKSRTDVMGDVISCLRLDKQYLVSSDISTCFPSIYTHALTWALITKGVAKDHVVRRIKNWEEKIDDYTRNMRDNETNGILIGPHVSNILSEIILTRIDEKLYEIGQENGFDYIRNIDDYQCYARTRLAAERFLASLKDALAEYNLSINYKKTAIKELPLCVDDTWMQKLKLAISVLPAGKIGRDKITAFLDVLVRIMKECQDGAVFSYALKVLAKRFLSEEARTYYVKTILHLAYCFPYLYPYLDENLFYAFDVEVDDVRNFSNIMVGHGLEVRNFEEVSYAFYFAIKYDFMLESFDIESIIASHDCILLLMVWRYAEVKGLKLQKRILHDYALRLSGQGDFDEYWLFCYEVLSDRELNGGWRDIKKNGVSFLKETGTLIPTHTPSHESFPIVWSCRIKYELSDGAEGDPVKEIIKEFKSDNSIYNTNAIVDQYLECVLGNLIVNSRLRRNVRIHRSPKYYVDKPAFGDSGEVHDSQVLRDVLNWMRAKHLVGERTGTKEKGGSCFWPKDELLKKFKNFNTGRIYRIDENGIVVLKDPSKKVVKPTPESKVKREYEERLTKINALYALHDFSCKLYGVDILDSFSPRLKAVFNDSKWTHGGRLYASATCRGFNYQCIPSDMRKHIKIDGNETVEVDYSGLHPTMLYAQKNMAIEGNAYDFLANEDKALAKFALLVMLNARTKVSAIGALRKRFDELRATSGLSHKKLMLRDALLRNSDFEKVVNDASQRHSRIRASFYRGVGIKLQNIESQMALDIVTYFSEKGVPVLPVHDSFIVDKRYEAEMVAYMRTVFAKYNHGFTCNVK